MSEKIQEKQQVVFVGGESARGPSAEEAEAMREWLETGTIPETYVQAETRSTVVLSPDKVAAPDWLLKAANRSLR